MYCMYGVENKPIFTDLLKPLCVEGVLLLITNSRLVCLLC